MGSSVGDRYREVGRTGGGCDGSQGGGRSRRELAGAAQNWFDLLGVRRGTGKKYFGQFSFAVGSL